LSKAGTSVVANSNFSIQNPSYPQRLTEIGLILEPEPEVLSCSSLPSHTCTL